MEDISTDNVCYTGIDQYKLTSYLVTADADGEVVQEAKLKNKPLAIETYFARLPGAHTAVVESTSG